jgi:hypothetical protein
MIDATKDFPVRQVHLGIGDQVGRDKYVSVELMDPKTKALVEKLCEAAPGFAKVIERAAREGIMSPDDVAYLNRAVDHLNEDTAMAFRYAAEHINEDTAMSFQCIAHDFTQVDQQLSARVTELNSASDDLRRMIEQVNSIQEPSAPDHQFQPSSANETTSQNFPRHAVSLWVASQLVCFCLGIGLLAMPILAHYRLERDVQHFDWIALVIPLVVWGFKVRQWWEARKNRWGEPPRPPL